MDEKEIHSPKIGTKNIPNAGPTMKGVFTLIIFACLGYEGAFLIFPKVFIYRFLLGNVFGFIACLLGLFVTVTLDYRQRRKEAEKPVKEISREIKENAKRKDNENRR